MYICSQLHGIIDMFVRNLIAIQTIKNGYIAGSDIGIVTVAGQPAKRKIELLDVTTYERLQQATSLANGHYLFIGIDQTKQYLVMCRDLPPNGTEQRYEPVVWDYVTPATDLTPTQQQELWQTWQTSP